MIFELGNGLGINANDLANISTCGEFATGGFPVFPSNVTMVDNIIIIPKVFPHP